MTRKRFLIALVLAGAIVVGNAQAQTAAQLHGRWLLTEHGTSGVGTFSPADGIDMWTANYFIMFLPNGTFVEQNFWTPEFVAVGSWTLSGGTLTLTLTGRDAGSFPFVATRSITISGDTMTMNYSRPLWNYVGTFMRFD